jgi:alkylhydroperoxidase family enzyme
MPRPVPAPDRSSFSAADLPDYDAVVQRNESKFGGVLPPYHAALLNSPPFAAGLNALGRVARTAGERDGTYSHADREFVDQVLSAEWKTAVVQGIHIPDALAVGVRVEAIEALRAGRDEDLTDDERLLATFIRQVVTGTVTDDTYQAIETRLGSRGAVEYTIFIAFLQMTIRLFQALGMPELPDDEIELMIQEFKDGTRALPDASVRFG